MTILLCAENLITYITMVICGEYFSLSPPNQSRKRIILTAGAFTLLLPAVCYIKIMNHGAALQLFTLAMTALYLVMLGISFHRMSLRLLYLITVIELITEQFCSGAETLLYGTPIRFMSGIATRLSILLLIMIFFRRTDRIRNNAAIRLIPRHIYVLFLLSLLVMSALITLNAYNIPPEKIMDKTRLINVILIVLSGLMTALLMSLLVNVISRQQTEATAKLLSEQVESQIRHHDRLERLDQEIKSFRHDYSNHLHSILTLIRLEEYAEAEKYILQLQEQKPMPGYIFCTGNKLADAILSDKAFSLPERIHIEFHGAIPPEVENTDLCVILSNSLSNAVEACLQRKGFSVIYISSEVRGGYLLLTVTNPTVFKGELTGIPQTTKPDKQNHGMGLANISNTVRKKGGQMKIKCSGGVFELRILIKLDQ